MFNPTRHAPSPRSAGLLIKPWAILYRTRPLKLERLKNHVQEVERLYLALKLLRTHFPHALVEQYPGSLKGQFWYQVLAHFLNEVEQHDWFEIDWQPLNEAWQHWLEAGDEENGDHLAVYLHCIPLRMYGFSLDNLHTAPAMELLRILLAREGQVEVVSAQLLIDAEIYDQLETDWSERHRESIRHLLDQIEADPGAWPEPVRFLPELVRWACGQTNNILLDRQFRPYHNGPWLRWDHHLTDLRGAYRRTKPLRNHLARLTAWVDEDAGRLARLAKFLMHGGSTDDLDW